ncbi:TRL-like family protein [Winogradskyella sp. YYF002]|uniref:TRL-like family protein n=1 Tax=Winogradskyella marincola TaxID=3037795 RepID=A0ABT6G4W4_9FLAO|nr:TRL-like family protein [Winogradskyella sp. YYF002]MDG4717079.1 TRL-like family protein [Winogradskyella sp. YYF002]
MKNNFLRCAFVVLMTISFSSCSITMPVTATSNPVGSKVGKSSATVVLGFAFDEDASIKSAAKQGGISKISTVDIKTKSILGLVVTYETIITGE